MTSFAVTTEHVDELVEQMGDFDSRVAARVSALDEQISALHAVWTGHASEAHQRAHQELLRGLQDMRDGLKQMQDAARQASSNYRGAAQTNVDMMGQVG